MEVEVIFKNQLRLTGVAESIKVNKITNCVEIYPVNCTRFFYSIDLDRIISVVKSTEPCHDWEKVY